MLEKLQNKWKKLDTTEKAIISVGVVVTLFLTVLVVTFNGEIEKALTTSDDTTASSSMSDVGDAASVDSDAGMVLGAIDVVDTGSGTAEVWLDLSDPVPVAGAELYFEVAGGLSVSQVTCGVTFSCGIAEYKDGVVTIVALRPLLEGNENLSGRVLLSEILYMGGTKGELVLNSGKVVKSEVASTGSDYNLIPTNQERFSVGY